MIRRLGRASAALAAGLLLSGIAIGQDAQAPPPLYSGNIGGGLALTGGNTDTQTFNVSGELTRDPQTRNVIKGTASYLRGDQNDVLNLDRTAVNVRDEFTLSGRTFAFGQVNYLRDQFKGIVFLWAPTAGLGHKLIDTDATELVLDGGVGGVLEKNPGLDARKSGSLTAGQSFRRELSGNATFTQSISTLWKTNDFSDSLTNFSVGVTTTLAGSLELQVEFIDSYKNRPVNALLKRNDTAFITAFIVTF